MRLIRVNLFTVIELNEWQSPGLFNAKIYAFKKKLYHTNYRQIFLVFRKERMAEIILNVLENLKVYS